MNNISVQKQILFILTKLFPPKAKDPEKKQIIIDCLIANNYINLTTEPIYSSPESEAFEEMERYHQQSVSQRVSQRVSQQVDQDNLQSLPGFTQREHVSLDLHGFSRTFISPSDDTGTKRLTEVQKRGITPEEVDFVKVGGLIDTALNRVNGGFNFEAVKNTALNIYLNITKFYIYQETIPRKDRLVQGENKGSVKLGYILLSLYYALNKMIPKELLVTYFSDISLSDIPKSEKNIKIIFENVRGYEFIYQSSQSMCNVSLNVTQKQQVLKVITDLQNAGLFNTPAVSVQVAASITYITNNLKLTSEKCGITEDTIRKNVKIIKKFYN